LVFGITGASCNLGWCWWFAVQDVGYGNEGHSFLCSKLFKTSSGACNEYSNFQIERILYIILP
jgi:hypothetical protein